MAFTNFFLLSKDMILGDHSAENIFPQPFFGLTRMHEKPNTLEHNAIDRLATDFAQIYFPSQEFSSLTQNYETGYLDPWKRPSRYPPFVHYICSITICKLDYGYASFAHMLIQTVLFYIAFILAFKELRIEKDLHLGLLSSTIFLFITPTGLGWLERGQFSLYVSIAYLLLILGLTKKNDVLVIASAIFAYIKWTSFPFLFVVIGVHLLSSRNLKEFTRSIRSALLYFLVIILLSLAFRSRFIHFVEGIFLQEAYVQPVGISMAQLLPAWIVKGLPLLLILVGYLCLRKNNKNFDCLHPFFTGAGILMLTYPTVAFEYNIPNLLCFIPLMFYWAGQPSASNKLAKYGLLFFIFLISNSGYVGSILNGKDLLLFYLLTSSVFIALPILRPEASYRQLSEPVSR
jgi:hypothetical protein